VVHSFGRGGAFATVFAYGTRERFRGLALCGSPPAAPPPDNHPSYPFKFLFVSPDKDRLAERIRRAAEILRKMKYPVTLVTAEGSERSYPAEETISELARWIDSFDRI
jgi:pimeloyl-ACP methyl ester carboxylesterase